MHADGNTIPSSYVRYFILPCTSIFNTTHLRAYNLGRYLKYIFKTKNISYINLRYRYLMKYIHFKNVLCPCTNSRKTNSYIVIDKYVWL